MFRIIWTTIGLAFIGVGLLGIYLLAMMAYSGLFDPELTYWLREANDQSRAILAIMCICSGIIATLLFYVNMDIEQRARKSSAF